mmetsp:Transcript_54431/g.74408  ORF Transcript_54431/g.74408 Transcript_54431/m.74408 type:complete len:445 (-) Transcript_54431:325-1659(-)
MTSYVMITLPNDSSGENAAATTFDKLQEAVSSPVQIATPKSLEVPKLLVGTLDSLMSLSDELGKIDSSVESVVKKIERQYLDVTGKDPEPLKVGGVPPNRFVEGFNWDIAKYPIRQALPELVQSILMGVGSIEEELKSLTVKCAETSQQLAALNRKKGGSLTMAPLEEVLTREVLSNVMKNPADLFVDSPFRSDGTASEYLRTLVVVVPRSGESAWQNSYSTIGADIAAFGGPNWKTMGGASCGSADGRFGSDYGGDRANMTGSPVVPGSSIKIFEEGEFSIWTVTILAGQYEAGCMDGDTFSPGNFKDYVEPFIKAAKELRFTVRPFTYNPEQMDDGKVETEELEAQLQSSTSVLIRWCKTHFGEAMGAWIHIKIIRAFVESVLRYGLPPNFVLAVLKPARNKEKQVQAALCKLMNYDPSLHADEAEEGGEYHPYVQMSFTIP